MSLTKNTQSTGTVATPNVPIKMKTSQREKKRERKHGAATTAIPSPMAPKSVRMDKETFDAAVAKHAAEPIVQNRAVLKTDDLKDGYTTKTKFLKAAAIPGPLTKSFLKAAPLPAPLTKSFSDIAGGAQVKPSKPQYVSPQPALGAWSASAKSAWKPTVAGNVHLPDLGAAAPLKPKKTASTPHTPGVFANAWSTNSGKKSSKLSVTQTKCLTVSNNTGASKTVIAPVNTNTQQLSSKLNSKFPALGRTPVAPTATVNHLVKSIDKTESDETKGWITVPDKPNKTSNVTKAAPAEESRNRFGALERDLTKVSKKAARVAQEKTGAVIATVEEPTSDESTADSSSRKKKTRSERKKMQKARAAKVAKKEAILSLVPAPTPKAAQDVVFSAIRPTGEKLPSDITVILGGTKVTVKLPPLPTVDESKSYPALTASQRQAEDKFPTRVVKKKTGSVPGTPAFVRQGTESKDDAKPTSTPALTEDEHQAKPVSALTMLTQEAYEHENLESRMLLCHGFDELDEDTAVLRIEEAYQHAELESRMLLSHGFDESNEEAEHIVRIESPCDYATMESRMLLCHGPDDLDEGIDVVRNEESYNYAALESRMLIQHGTDDRLDDQDDAEEDVKVIHEEQDGQEIVTLDETTLDIVRRCDIVLAEIHDSHKVPEKFSPNDWKAYQQVLQYGREIDADDEQTEMTLGQVETSGSETKNYSDGSSAAAALSSAPSSPPFPTTAVETDTFAIADPYEDRCDPLESAGWTNGIRDTCEAPGHSAHTTVVEKKVESVPCEDDASNNRMPLAEVRAHNTYMGTISLADFTTELSTLARDSLTYSTKDVMVAFSALSTREREVAGMEALDGAFNAKIVMHSRLLQAQIKLGRMKLVDFLALLPFEDGKTTMDAVIEAFQTAADDEKQFRKSDAGNALAWVIRKWC